MNAEQVKETLRNIDGLTENTYGHFKFTDPKGDECRIKVMKRIAKIEVVISEKPKVWSLKESLTISKLFDDTLTTTVNAHMGITKPEEKDMSKKDKKSQAKTDGSPVAPAFTKKQMSTKVYKASTIKTMANRGFSSGDVTCVVDEAFGDDLQSVKWSALRLALTMTDIIDATESDLTWELFRDCQVEVETEEPKEMTKKEKKAAAKAAKAAKAGNDKPKKKGASPKWKPGFTREPVGDAVDIRANSHSGRIVTAIGDGINFEDIAEAVSLTDVQVKSQMRNLARKNGIGWTIDDDNILTLLGDAKVVESKAAAKKTKAKDKTKDEAPVKELTKKEKKAAKKAAKE